ncbi:unnamed protein product, partial [Owenia fusiformis]
MTAFFMMWTYIILSTCFSTECITDGASIPLGATQTSITMATRNIPRQDSTLVTSIDGSLVLDETQMSGIVPEISPSKQSTQLPVISEISSTFQVSEKNFSTNTLQSSYSSSLIVAMATEGVNTIHVSETPVLDTGQVTISTGLENSIQPIMTSVSTLVETSMPILPNTVEITSQATILTGSEFNSGILTIDSSDQLVNSAISETLINSSPSVVQQISTLTDSPSQKSSEKVHYSSIYLDLLSTELSIQPTRTFPSGVLSTPHVSNIENSTLTSIDIESRLESISSALTSISSRMNSTVIGPVESVSALTVVPSTLDVNIIPTIMSNNSLIMTGVLPSIFNTLVILPSSTIHPLDISSPASTLISETESLEGSFGSASQSLAVTSSTLPLGSTHSRFRRSASAFSEPSISLEGLASLFSSILETLPKIEPSIDFTPTVISTNETALSEVILPSSTFINRTGAGISITESIAPSQTSMLINTIQMTTPPLVNSNISSSMPSTTALVSNIGTNKSDATISTVLPTTLEPIPTVVLTDSVIGTPSGNGSGIVSMTTVISTLVTSIGLNNLTASVEMIPTASIESTSMIPTDSNIIASSNMMSSSTNLLSELSPSLIIPSTILENTTPSSIFITTQSMVVENSTTVSDNGTKDPTTQPPVNLTTDSFINVTTEVPNNMTNDTLTPMTTEAPSNVTTETPTNVTTETP